MYLIALSLLLGHFVHPLPVLIDDLHLVVVLRRRRAHTVHISNKGGGGEQDKWKHEKRDR